MCSGLDLYCTDPAQLIITADTGSTYCCGSVDDLDRDLSDVINEGKNEKSFCMKFVCRIPTQEEAARHARMMRAHSMQKTRLTSNTIGQRNHKYLAQQLPASY